MIIRFEKKASFSAKSEQKPENKLKDQIKKNDEQDNPEQNHKNKC